MRRPRVVHLAYVILAVLLLMALFPSLVASIFGNGDPTSCDLNSSVAGPRSGHPFGFDVQGCDLFANVVYGARNSLVIGIAVTALDIGLALVIGSIAGFYGGVVDGALSRVTDVFLAFPFVLGALVLLTSFDSHSVTTVSLVLAFFGWPTFVRVMRAGVLEAKSADYVLASRGLGASDWRLVTKHIVPNSVAPLLVLAPLTVASVIVSESALSFLGVGLRPPAISWGLQLSGAQNVFRLHPEVLLWPATFLAVSVFAFVVVGESLRRSLDPGEEE